MSVKLYGNERVTKKLQSKEKVVNSAPHNCHKKWFYILGQKLDKTIKTKTKSKEKNWYEIFGTETEDMNECI